MVNKERDTRQWTGLGKIVGVLIVGNVLLCIITLGVAGTYASELSQVGIDTHKVEDAIARSGGKKFVIWEFLAFFAFAAVGPSVSLVWAVLDMIMHILGINHPIYAMIRLFVFTVAWVVQMIAWITCGIVKAQPNVAVTQKCYQSYAKRDSHGHLDGLSPSLGNSMVACGMLVLLTHATLFVLAIVGIVRWIKNRRRTYATVSKYEQ